MALLIQRSYFIGKLRNSGCNSLIYKVFMHFFKVYFRCSHKYILTDGNNIITIFLEG